MGVTWRAGLLAIVLAAGVAVSAGSAQQSRPRDAEHDVSIALNRALRTAAGGGSHVPLADDVVLKVPPAQLFLPRPGADALLQAAERAVPADYVGLLVDGSTIDWFTALQVVNRGHVDADAVASWTPNDLIASVRDAVEQDNVERLAHGGVPLEVRRWVQRPQYDASRHRLSWCLLVVPRDARRDAGGEIVYHAVTFGRSGYVDLAMTTTVDQLPRQQGIPGDILDHIEYLPGHGFADFQAGTDAVDPGGLTRVFGAERIRKADLKTRLHAFGAPLLIPGEVALIVVMLGSLVAVLYRWRHVRRPARRG